MNEMDVFYLQIDGILVVSPVSPAILLLYLDSITADKVMHHEAKRINRVDILKH